MQNLIVKNCEDLHRMGYRVLAVSIRTEAGRWVGRIVLGMVPAGGEERRLKLPKGVKLALSLGSPADVVVPLPPLTSRELAEATIAEVALEGEAEDYATFHRKDGLAAAASWTP